MKQIPSWVAKIFTPKVNELIGEVRGLNTKVDSLKDEMLARFDALEAGIPVMEKIAGLEVRLAEVERKLRVHA